MLRTRARTGASKINSRRGNETRLEIFIKFWRIVAFYVTFFFFNEKNLIRSVQLYIVMNTCDTSDVCNTYEIINIKSRDIFYVKVAHCLIAYTRIRLFCSGNHDTPPSLYSSSGIVWCNIYTVY